MISQPISTKLGYQRGPLAPNYAAYGVTPPMPEQLVKLAEQAIRLDTEQYGVWPNPAKDPNKLENWRGRMTHRMNAYLKAFEIHKSEWSSMVSGYKATMEAEKRFDWAYAKELADKEIGIRARSKGPTVADNIPGGDMMKKQAPAHESTIEQVSAANAAFKKTEPEPDADAGLNEWFKRETTKDLHKELNEQASKEESDSPELAESKMNPKNPFLGYYTSLTAWGYRTEEQKRAFNKAVFGEEHMYRTGLRSNEASSIAKSYQFAPADKKADYVWKRDLTASISPDQELPKTEVAKPIETSTTSQPEPTPEAPKAETGTTLPTPITDKPQNAPLSAKERHMTEAPFSANFRMLNQLGVEVQFTIRDEKVADGVEKLDKLIPLLMERGYTPSNGGRSHTPVPATPSASTPNMNGNGSASNGSDSGTVACMMIEVGTTYQGGKPALKFSCDGYENPLQFAKQPGEMIKLLSKVKQATGAAFTAEDLTNGRKFGGTWKVVWKDALGKDEKMHRNVIDVLPATA